MTKQIHPRSIFSDSIFEQSHTDLVDLGRFVRNESISSKNSSFSRPLPVVWISNFSTHSDACPRCSSYRKRVIVNNLHRKKVVGKWSVSGRQVVGKWSVGGRQVVGRWSVGGRPTTYRPPTDHLPTTYRPLFYGAACSRLPLKSMKSIFLFYITLNHPERCQPKSRPQIITKSLKTHKKDTQAAK